MASDLRPRLAITILRLSRLPPPLEVVGGVWIGCDSLEAMEVFESGN